MKDAHLKTRSTLRIGCAGWSVSRDNSQLFPSGKSHLERYASMFSACEINSSFYRPHKIETWKRWGESVPAEFRFSIKAPKIFTHELALNCSEEVLSPFFQRISALKEKLGPVLFQLPPNLAFARSNVAKFLALLRQRFEGEVVCEPRHQSWFTEECDVMLNDFNVSRVAADPAVVASAAQPGGRRSLVYFRLHGSPRTYYSSYSEDYLDTLEARIARLLGESHVWCIFDNTAAGFAVRNAIGMLRRLDQESEPPSDQR